MRHALGKAAGGVRAGALVLLAAAALTACSGEQGADDASTEQAAAVPSTSPDGAGEPAPTIVQPGAPGEPNRVIDASEAAAINQPVPHTWADVRFMQMMIAHHAQALRMTALIEDRSDREDLPLLARRMDISQVDEIEQMQRWLEQRGETAPDPDDAEQMAAIASGHGDHRADGDGDFGASDPGDDGLMPGMLTEEELAELEDASGSAFDRLWLESMIRHHEGAVAMVEDLFATEGAGQETEVFRLADHINSDQGIEISRMHDLLAEIAEEQ